MRLSRFIEGSTQLDCGNPAHVVCAILFAQLLAVKKAEELEAADAAA